MRRTLHAFFSTDVASQILRIPISQHGGEDFSRWSHTKFGEYSVRSAYNLARSANFLLAQSSSGHGQCFDRGREEKQWKTLWSVRAPNKMKIVLWRFAHDCLPSGMQLQQHHVPASVDCPFCCRPESVEHCMLFCPYACHVRDEVKLDFDIKLSRSDFRAPKQWLFDFISRSSNLHATVMAVTFWYSWDAQNSARNNNKASHPRRTAAKVKAYVDMIVSHLGTPCFRSQA